jgi:molybdate transport system ATP-binding protein
MSVELVQIRLQLERFSLEVDATLTGRVTAIFGASGAGKTSLLEVIAGLRRPATGTVRVNGNVLTDSGSRLFAPPERRGIGYVPQDGALFPHLSVRQNLLYGYDAVRSRPAGLNFDHVTEVLEIAALVDRRIGTLSGGEKKRVALGRALLAAPQLLLLDEPLAALDGPLRERLLPYFIRVRDEFSVPMIYVTHSPDEVMALCDEVLLLADGKVKSQGTPGGLFVAASGIRYVLAQRNSDATVK